LQKKDLCFCTGNENKIGILCLQKRNLLNASTYWFGLMGVGVVAKEIGKVANLLNKFLLF